MPDTPEGRQFAGEMTRRRGWSNCASKDARLVTAAAISRTGLTSRSTVGRSP